MLRVLIATFKPVLQQICLLSFIKMLVASCTNTDFSLDIITRESRYTLEVRHLLLNKFALGRY